MCGGGRAQSPKVEYVGPSEEDIARQEEALQTYRDQSEAQQAAFSAQLQQQMDDAELRNQQLVAQYQTRQAEQANMQAARAASAYTVTTQAAKAPTTAQTTTTAATPKKNQKRNLKISGAGASNAGGAGVNLSI